MLKEIDEWLRMEDARREGLPADMWGREAQNREAIVAGILSIGTGVLVVVAGTVIEVYQILQK